MKKIIIFTIVVLFCGITSTMCWAQTSTSFPGSTGSSNSQNNQQNIAGNPQLMIPIIIGTMLRASDRHIRLEALQSMVAVLGQSQGNTNNNSTNNTSIAGLFSINNQNNTSNNNNNNNNNNTSTGSTLGGAVFLPDLYTLLDDPDQEIRDLAAVGIDQLMGSDVTIMNFLKDPDPIIRKYALKIMMAKELGQKTSGGGNSQQQAVMNQDLLILRILLVMLKDPDPDVKQAASDGLDQYVNQYEPKTAAGH